MLRKMRNNRAAAWYVILWLTPATSIFVEAGATMAGAAYLLRHSHRARKAVEFCVSEGFTESTCQAQVNTMSREEILVYIKDDDVDTRENLNKGIFQEGKQFAPVNFLKDG